MTDKKRGGYRENARRPKMFEGATTTINTLVPIDKEQEMRIWIDKKRDTWKIKK